jgi:hypothetical protein
MEDTAPSNEDTPEEQPQGAPEQTDGQANWEERYNNLQPAYTQATQRLSDYEAWANALDSDPDVQTDTFRNLADRIGVQKALELLGYSDEDQEDPDPTSAQEQRLAALEQRLEQQQAEASESQTLASMEQYVEGWFDQAPEKLSKQQQDWIISRAVTLPDRDGAPDLEGAYEEFKALLGESQKAWLKSKRNAVHAPQGTPGTQEVDLTDPEQRKARMAQIAAAQAED